MIVGYVASFPVGQCMCSLPSVYHDSGICSLIPRPSPLPDFDHLHYAITEREDLCL